MWFQDDNLGQQQGGGGPSIGKFAAVDAAAGERLEPQAGFGACSKGDCPCQAFEGGASANNCTNCGHLYGDHW